VSCDHVQFTDGRQNPPSARLNGLSTKGSGIFAAPGKARTYQNETVEQAEIGAFVDEWVKGWNSHDLTNVLNHFADDVTFTSPVASLILTNSEGVVQGKEALRAYWQEGLRRVPDLHFEVLGTYVGVHTLVINYRNQKGVLVNEVLEFEGNLVIRGHGAYVGDSMNPAGAIAKSD
jgi:hypothetical protein